MKDSAVRIGLVGVGAVAQRAYLPIFTKMKGVEVRALCDNDGLSARALADRFGVPDVFTDIDELLDLEELDAVVIATPNHLHEPHVLSALRAGVHVLCGRPLALSTRGVERIIALAKKSGRHVMMDNPQRYRADAQGLARFVQGGELGKLVSIRAGLSHPRGSIEGWRTRRAESGGGAFMEYGLPILDLALWIADFPEPERVHAHMQRARGASAVEDTMLVHLVTARGFDLVIDVNWAVVTDEERDWFDVTATTGSARLSPLRVFKEMHGRAVNVSPSGATSREGWFLQSYRAELAHFVAVVRGEVEYEPPEDQVTLSRVVEAVYKSAEDGKEIRL